MPKIIAVCPVEYPGVNSVLTHGESLGLWKCNPIEENLPENDFVILGAWHPSYEMFLEKYKCIVYLTSTFGQMEFSDNMVEIKNVQYLLNLVSEKKLKAIISGWNDVADYFKSQIPDKAFYCPYPFSESLIKASLKVSTMKEEKAVGVFLPFAPRKNVLNQLLAARYSGMKVYTNLPYNIKGINAVKWLPRIEYLQMISKLTLTLHCTFTESFSYGAAESLILGTLPIVSLQICENLNLLGDIVCYQLDSVSEILTKIKKIRDINEDEYNHKVKISQAGFKFKNELNLKVTKDVLDKLGEIVAK